ncbi:hypothetical protein ISCGN_006174, partial [Ixodes scapularis]
SERLLVVQYADDTSILLPASDPSSCQHLQDYFEEVEHWALANHLHLSPNKSGVMRFSASRKTDPPAYRLMGANLVPCKTLTILGVVFSPTLGFSAHIAGVVARARRTLVLVARVAKSCEPGALRTLYTAMVLPTLEYCCFVWSPSQQHLVDRIKSIQRKASRTICYRVGGNDFGTDTTYNDQLRTLGWRLLRHRRQVSLVSLACRVLDGFLTGSYLTTVVRVGRRTGQPEGAAGENDAPQFLDAPSSHQRVFETPPECEEHSADQQN